MSHLFKIQIENNTVMALNYFNRLFHHRLFYKKFHKQHHEWTAPIALSAAYCHPVEHLVANLLTPALGVVILDSHIITTWIWFSIMTIATLNDHSGYHLPFFPSPEAHDFHHLKFNQCYGVIGVLDYLHGTDSNYRTSLQYKRNIVSTTLTPLRTLYPDQPKK